MRRSGQHVARVEQGHAELLAPIGDLRGGDDSRERAVEPLIGWGHAAVGRRHEQADLDPARDELPDAGGAGHRERPGQDVERQRGAGDHEELRHSSRVRVEGVERLEEHRADCVVRLRLDWVEAAWTSRCLSQPRREAVGGRVHRLREHRRDPDVQRSDLDHLLTLRSAEDPRGHDVVTGCRVVPRPYPPGSSERPRRRSRTHL